MGVSTVLQSLSIKKLQPKQPQPSGTPLLEIDGRNLELQNEEVDDDEVILVEDPMQSQSKRPRHAYSSASSSSFHQSSINSFVDGKMARSEKEHIDYLYAKYVHLHCVSFDPFNNEAGLSFLRRMRPAYFGAGGLPNREKVSGAFLDKHEREVMGNVAETITRALSVGLSTDGWTDVNSAGLHNMMVSNPIPYLLGTVRKPAATEDADTLYNMVKDMANTVIAFFTRKSM